MKVKELLSNDFKKDENIMKITIDGPDEFGMKHFVGEGQYDNEEFVIIFNIPGPFFDESYMKDLCLRYGHGMTRFLEALDEFLIEERTDVLEPLYKTQQPVDFYIKEGKQHGPKRAHFFSTKEKKLQVGFIGSESEKLTEMLVAMFNSYFGGNVDFGEEST